MGFIDVWLDMERCSENFSSIHISPPRSDSHDTGRSAYEKELSHCT